MAKSIPIPEGFGSPEDLGVELLQVKEVIDEIVASIPRRLASYEIEAHAWFDTDDADYKDIYVTCGDMGESEILVITTLTHLIEELAHSGGLTKESDYGVVFDRAGYEAFAGKLRAASDLLAQYATVARALAPAAPVGEVGQ